METYRKYFDIDPKFFPLVNNDLILQDPDLWKRYYPHETFISLVKQTINVLERKQKLNIWVQGPYGTGKSHAVLTLKHLLDAAPDDIRAYFAEYGISKDICEQFISAKKPNSEGGPLITIHRYGSSSINSDKELFFAMQESINEALREKGVTAQGPMTMRDAILDYLSDEENKHSMEVFIKGSYSSLFGGNDIDTIVENLKNYTSEALKSLIDNIIKLGEEKNINIFNIDDSKMVKWITEIIHENKLKGIVFIWDEFSEYFVNNVNRLTGFQHVLELSEQIPFCFIPVTHRSIAFFDAKDANRKKIMDRFINPVEIELPENMAFKLMGQAMRTKNDEVVKEEWKDIKADLYERTKNARERVKKHAKIEDQELLNILPIHPYTACVLKQISSNFSSNQRSMFNFIKNTASEENKGFQWYIDNFGPLDNDNPFLTIDLLWGFFYETGKNGLSEPIRHILDQYGRLSIYLNEDEQRVLKTILIFQAMDEQSLETIDIYQPNEENLSNAFEGTDLGEGKANQIAKKLVEDKRIYKKMLRDDKFAFSVLSGEIDSKVITKNEEELRKRTTSNLIKDGELSDVIVLPHDLRLRFNMNYVGITEFTAETKKINSYAEDDPSHFFVFVCLSKNSKESSDMSNRIQQFMEANPKNKLIFLDCGINPLGDEAFDKWVEYSATALFFSGKDNNQSKQYTEWAKKVLMTWKAKLAQGQGVLYSQVTPSGKNIHNLDILGGELREIDRRRFPLSLECNFKSSEAWWFTNSFNVGVECGIKREVKGTYNNKNANLQEMLSFAWSGDYAYWKEQPAKPISQIKTKLEHHIESKLNFDGRISIMDIYTFLQNEPFGFLPCNMTAFFMGFLLKEYVNDTYSWSNSDISEPMSLQKMQEMIVEVLAPKQHLKNKYIVMMSLEEKEFIKDTARIFDIPQTLCTSIENTIVQIRLAMKNKLLFPVWTIVGILKSLQISDIHQDEIGQLIMNYQELANNTTGQADNNIAQHIGKKLLALPNIVDILREIFSNKNCRDGMQHYLGNYKNGELIRLANEVNNATYLNDLKDKLNADEANWLWKPEIINQQIDSLIIEYGIVAETNKRLQPSTNYQETIKKWKEKVSFIKLTFEQIKKHEKPILPLLTFLREIYSKGYIQESAKQSFLDALQAYGDDFINFYSRQFDDFKQECKFYLQDLTEENKKDVFNKLPGNVFCLDNTDFISKLEQIVVDYKNGLGSKKIRDIWKKRTQTESPYKWSNVYKMPILAMVDDNKYSECRSIFSIINSANPSDKDLGVALKYLESFQEWDKLSSSAERDKAFREKILKEQALLVDNIEELKEYISNHTLESPYDWMGNPQVENLILGFVQAQYNSQGWAIAMEKIRNLPADKLKQRIEELIKNNMGLGIQIIKTLN